jgi:hypothetical protein
MSYVDMVLESLINQGVITKEEFDKKVEEFKFTSPINDLIIKNQTVDEKFNAMISDDSDLENLKDAKINVLKEQCSIDIYNGFTSSIIRDGEKLEFGMNTLDQANYTQQMILIIGDTQNLIQTIEWKTKNKGVVNLTKSEFLQVINDAKNHKVKNQSKYWRLEDEVLASNSLEELLGVIW